MALPPNNQVAKCTYGMIFAKRKLSDITTIVVHHLGLSATNGGEVADQFRKTGPYEPGAYTGGKMPYHFFIRKDGTIDQCLPLILIGPGAKALNKCGIQVAVSGEFHKKLPAPAQWDSLIALCAGLKLAYRWKLLIVGHTEDKGLNTSSDPNKECPGKFLDMAALRQAVDNPDPTLLYAKPEWLLCKIGIV